MQSYLKGAHSERIKCIANLTRIEVNSGDSRLSE